MSDLIRRCLQKTWKEMRTELAQVPSDHWNESVFRYHFVKQLLKLAPGCTPHSEWNRIDLVVQDEQVTYAVEFKFFIHRTKTALDGKSTRKKGGPSKQNKAEFEKSVNNLRALKSKRVWGQGSTLFQGAYLVLLFADPLSPKLTKTFDAEYGSLENGDDPRYIVELVAKSKRFGMDRTATCLLLDVDLKN